MATVLDLVQSKGGFSFEFLPIFRLVADRRDFFGVECLARGPIGSRLESPAELFAAARGEEEKAEIERFLVIEALRVASELPALPNLSINVEASLFERGKQAVRELEKLAYENDVPPARVILEMSGYRSVPEEALAIAIRELHRIDVRVALSEDGQTPPTADVLKKLAPRFLKLERPLVKGLETGDAKSRAVVAAAVGAARGAGVEVMVAGIESEIVFKQAAAAGIVFVEGYYLSKPLSRKELASSPYLTSGPRRETLSGWKPPQ